MKFFKVFSVIVLLLPAWASAQTVKGVVKADGAEGEALPFAVAFWLGTEKGTTTEADGSFELAVPPEWPAQLVISFVGYKSDTLLLKGLPDNPLDIQLERGIEMIGVKIEEKSNTTQISTLSPINVETVTDGELRKAACCNLSESFETNASVDVQVTDAVSGAKQIRMLGLDGIYSQVLMENMPFIRGLSSAYGLHYVPGTWVKSISITKGTGSVINGYEAVTGQINICMYEAGDDPHKVMVNAYTNNMGRNEVNFQTGSKIGERWTTRLFVSGNYLGTENDNNNDGFLDMPKHQGATVFNRWKYAYKNYRSQYGIRLLSDELKGGQMGFDYDRDFGTVQSFGVGVEARQAEVFTKQGFLFDSHDLKSIGIQVSSRYHEQESYFGNKTYNGIQRYLYGNFIYQSILWNSDHKFKVGGSFVYDDYDESFSDSAFTRSEQVPGVFGEYTFHDNHRWSVVAGLRSDYHNLYGLQTTPRLHLKYNLAPESVFRLSAGRGFRVPNLFAENAAVFASSRRVVINGDISPEVAWNFGLNYTTEFHIGSREATFSTDVFRTEFTDQWVVDLENPDLVQFYNLDGPSYSNSFMVDLTYEVIDGLDIKTSYRWYEVRTTFRSGEKRKPLVPDHRVLVNLGYSTEGKKWQFDLTGHWFGESRVPSTATNDPENRVAEKSDPYFLMMGQVRRNFKSWNVYLGGENLTKYQQPNAIIAANDPFGDDFDASLIWGPVAGRIIYAGVSIDL